MSIEWFSKENVCQKCVFLPNSLRLFMDFTAFEHFLFAFHGKLLEIIRFSLNFLHFSRCYSRQIPLSPQNLHFYPSQIFNLKIRLFLFQMEYLMKFEWENRAVAIAVETTLFFTGKSMHFLHLFRSFAHICNLHVLFPQNDITGFPTSFPAFLCVVSPLQAAVLPAHLPVANPTQPATDIQLPDTVRRNGEGWYSTPSDQTEISLEAGYGGKMWCRSGGQWKAWGGNSEGQW